ncbi:structural constituent of ribosome [Kockovaella imperatae]|uniref:60S ribosomal protein L6 n=1 Tax=Kockovaella imperatae TaxID=4999 RepID=A0A1Y1UK97_9TREE|nr:structural constituent of ribosome [Kockovaella imperatae]ORX38471.1 structural constituent of ribosome [Kockovaella imperatae]
MARSKPISPHVGRLSRSQVAAKRGLHKGKKTAAVAAKTETPEFTEKTVGGKGNGQKRSVPTRKASKYYPAEDVKQARVSRKATSKTALRPSITPGTVLILLSGRFSGKRVVCLKQLDSGLLLVTGPFKLNGVPLRRVNQAYVIATSTKVDISSISIPSSVNDSYFAKAKAAKNSKEGEFFGEGEKSSKTLPEDKKSEQKTVDGPVLEAIKKVDNLGRYLKSSWGLSKSDRFHELKF